MPAMLNVTRETTSLMELRRGTFEIALDGETVGSIDRHQTFKALIEPGHHQLEVRIGRYSSGSQSFDIADGDTINFRCNSAKIWPVYLASLLAPNLALNLKHE
jgi:hypothetical protein